MPADFQLDSKAQTLVFDEPLTEAILLERPNRYVAKVLLASGSTVKGHVPVGGRIGGLTLDGLPCLISGPYSNRSTEYSVEAIGSHYDKTATGFQWIGINQTASNRYVESLLRAGLLAELSEGFDSASVQREQMLGKKRIDFFVGDSFSTGLWIEVKTPLIELSTVLDSNVPVKTDFGKAAPSSRMPEQFEELTKVVRKGSRAALLGVFAYSSLQTASARERYLANLNLDGLVDGASAAGIEVWALELSMSAERLALSSLVQL